jgi:hypothetical protein
MANSVLFDDAQTLLAACLTALANEDIDPPEITRVTASEPVDDCSHLSVWMTQFFTGTPQIPNPAPERCGWPLAAEYQIVIKRCIKVASGRGGPKVEDQEEDAEAILKDVWAIKQGLVEQYHDQTLFRDRQFWLGPFIPAGFVADLGGYILTVQVEIDG